jgi:hypothetical protein
LEQDQEDVRTPAPPTYRCLRERSASSEASEGGPFELAGRSHEAVGNGGRRWMVAHRMRREAREDRTRPTGQHIRSTLLTCGNGSGRVFQSAHRSPPDQGEVSAWDGPSVTCAMIEWARSRGEEASRGCSGDRSSRRQARRAALHPGGGRPLPGTVGVDLSATGLADIARSSGAESSPAPRW